MIPSGALQIGDGGADGSIGTATITNNGSLIFNTSSSRTMSNVIAGIGALYQAGTGTVSLTGSNTFAGATSISQGALSISTVASLGSAQPLRENGIGLFTGASSSAPGVLRYVGGTATLRQNLMVTGHDYGLVDNAGGGVLTLSGFINKSGSVLTLAGGKFVVTGAITGSSTGSDLDIGSTQ